MRRRLALLPVEAGDFALCFAEFDTFFQVVSLVAVGFAFADADFDFDAGIIPIHPQAWQGGAFDGHGVFEFDDFLFVEEQAARAGGFVLEPCAGRFPWLDVAAEKENLAALDAGEAVGDIDLAGAHGFDLSAFEFEAGLESFFDMEIAVSLAIGGDVLAHRDACWVPDDRHRMDRGHGSQVDPARLVVGTFTHEPDFPLDNFGEGNIRCSHGRNRGDKRRSSVIELTDAL